MYKVKPEYSNYVRHVFGGYKKALKDLTQKEVEQWAEESPEEVQKYFTIEQKADAKAKD